MSELLFYERMDIFCKLTIKEQKYKQFSLNTNGDCYAIINYKKAA